MTRCLFIACSNRKRPDPDRMPAVDRYDGPWYRTLRRWSERNPENDLSVWVLSAEFGLIPGDTPIPDYNRTMNTGRAIALKDQIEPALQQALTTCDDACICAGKPYVFALQQCRETVPEIGGAIVIPGGIGTKMAHLKRWLG